MVGSVKTAIDLSEEIFNDFYNFLVKIHGAEKIPSSTRNDKELTKLYNQFSQDYLPFVFQTHFDTKQINEAVLNASLDVIEDYLQSDTIVPQGTKVKIDPIMYKDSRFGDREFVVSKSIGGFVKIKEDLSTKWYLILRFTQTKQTKKKDNNMIVTENERKTLLKLRDDCSFLPSNNFPTPYVKSLIYPSFEGEKVFRSGDWTECTVDKILENGYINASYINKENNVVLLEGMHKTLFFKKSCQSSYYADKYLHSICFHKDDIVKLTENCKKQVMQLNKWYGTNESHKKEWEDIIPRLFFKIVTFATLPLLNPGNAYETKYAVLKIASEKLFRDTVNFDINTTFLLAKVDWIVHTFTPYELSETPVNRYSGYDYYEEQEMKKKKEKEIRERIQKEEDEDRKNGPYNLNEFVGKIIILEEKEVVNNPEINNQKGMVTKIDNELGRIYIKFITNKKDEKVVFFRARTNNIKNLKIVDNIITTDEIPREVVHEAK